MEYSEGSRLLDMVIQYGEANLEDPNIIDEAYESIYEVNYDRNYLEKYLQAIQNLLPIFNVGCEKRDPKALDFVIQNMYRLEKPLWGRRLPK